MLFRSASLMRINFSKSTVVVDPNNKVIQQLIREGKLAAYDPKTDTFYFTKDGMDEMTVLHEIVHAGTIKILHAFKTNPNSLTPEQRAAAEQESMEEPSPADEQQAAGDPQTTEEQQ